MPDTITLGQYLNSVILSPIAVPLILLVVPEWRFSKKSMLRFAVVLEAFLILLLGGIWQLFGPAHWCVWLAGLSAPFVVCLSLLWMSQYRDGRALFALLATMMNSSICDVLAGLLFSRADEHWYLVRLGVALVDGLLVYFVLRKPFFELLTSNGVQWWWFCVLPMLITVSIYQYLGPTAAISPFPAVLLCLIGLMTYVTLYIFQRKLTAHAAAEQDAVVLRSEIEAMSRQQALAQAAAEDMRIFRHDTRHYAGVLRGCLDNGDMDGAREVLDALDYTVSTPAPTAPNQNYTGNTLIDTVLTQAAVRAGQAGITYTVRMTLPAPLSIDATEFAVVLSNALDNALNAAAAEPAGKPRTVTVTGTPRGERLLLVVSNSFTGHLALDPITGLPRHPGGLSSPDHGYGTRSIAVFAEKHGCLLDYTQKDGTVQMRLL